LTKVYAFIMLVLLLLCSCSAEKSPFFTVGERFEGETDSDPNISMTVLPGSAAADTVAVTIANHSDHELILDGELHFTLQVYQEDGWYLMEIEPRELWDSKPYNLAPDESMEMTFQWAETYGVLPAGHYRVVKVCDIIHDHYEFTSLLLTSEFTL